MKVQFSLLTTKYRKPFEQKPKNIMFKGFDCPEDSFEIKNLYNIPCPICSIPMIRRNQIDDFVDTASCAKGEDLIEILKKYEKYYHESEAIAANLIMFEAEKNPNLTIKEISQKLAQQSGDNIRTDLEDSLLRIKTLGNSLNNASEQRGLNAIVDEHIASINAGKYSINKKDFQERVETLIKSNFSTRKRILKAIDRLPEVTNNGEKFFTKYASKTPAEIASRLVTPAFITCDHINPKSQGGLNNTANYLAECEECNSLRGNKSFMEYISQIPSVKKNLQNYIQQIASRLANGELARKYDSYLQDIATTINLATQHRITLDVPVVQYPKESTSDEFDFDEYLERFRKNLSLERQKLADLKTQTTEAQSNPNYQLVLDYKRLVAEKTSLIKQLEEAEKNVRDKKQAIQKYYKKLNELNQKKEKYYKTPTNTKESANIRSDMAKLESYLRNKNPEEMEKRLEEYTIKVQELKAKLTKTEEEIEYIKSRIDFPQSFQEEIRTLKGEIIYIQSCQADLRKNQKESPIENLQAKIKEKEKELQRVSEENSRIDTTSSTGHDLLEYRHLISLKERVGIISSIYEGAIGKKMINDDSEIFSYAQEAIVSKIQRLTDEKPSVQYQINLETISQITRDIQSLYEQLERTRNEVEEQQELRKQIEEYEKTIQEKESRVSELEQRQKEAQLLFDSSNIQVQIDYLKSDIERKEKLLREYDKGLLDNEEFIEFASM